MTLNVHCSRSLLLAKRRCTSMLCYIIFNKNLNLTSSMFCQFFPTVSKMVLNMNILKVNSLLRILDTATILVVSWKSKIFMWVGGFEMMWSTLQREQYTNFSVLHYNSRLKPLDVLIFHVKSDNLGNPLPQNQQVT